MIYKGTMKYFRNLIIIESMLCINRSYLIDSLKVKTICQIIFISTITIILGTFAYDLFLTTIEIGTGKRILQSFVAYELIYLAVGAKWDQTFIAIERLDDKCGINDEYVAKIKSGASKAAIQGVLAATLNVIAGFLLMEPSVAVIFAVATTAHDAEVDFIRLLINGFNIRLSKLKDASSYEGSRVYRYILMTAAHLSEEFNSRISLMLAVILIKTTIYVSVIVLADLELYTAFLLIWRQIKSLHALCMLCSTASNTKTICEDLSLHFAKRLVFSLDIHTNQYEVTRRLYRSVLKQRPQYMNGAIRSMDMVIPLKIIDVSVNYLLIVLQVYMAYK